jgi:hypothetical protein
MPHSPDTRPVFIRLSALLFTVAVNAMPAPAAKIIGSCHGFGVELVSRSGDPMEDDMDVTLVFAGKRVAVPLQRALFTPRHTLQNVPNLCPTLAAVPVGGNRVALLLSRNSRPKFDRLDIVLFDSKEQKVLDVRDDMGEIRTESDLFVLRSLREGMLDVRLIHEYLENSGCDCAEAAIEEWTRLRFTAGKIEKVERHAGRRQP